MSRVKRAINSAIASFGRRLFDVYCDPVQAMRLEALRETVDYIRSHARDAMGLRSREKLLDVALSRMPAEGHVLEFGVHRGASLTHIANRIAPREVTGFDSFRGNPEDWTGWNAPSGVFDLGGRMPQVPANARLVPGYFDASLPAWAARNPGDIAFLHIDCDLYASTRTVFDVLGARIRPGTVIVFDEYFNYTNWQAHEFKAFQELVAERAMRYRYLAYSTKEVAVIIDEVGAALPAEATEAAAP